MKLSDYLTAVYFPKRLNLRKRTRSLMESDIRQFDKFLERPSTVSDLTEETISAYLLDLLDRGDSPHTAKSRRGFLLTLWRDCYRRRKTIGDVTSPHEAEVPMPILTWKAPRAWTLDQLHAMLNQAAVARPRYNRWFGPKHWTALILLIYHTGLRISAILHLEKSSLNGSMLLVPAEIQKDRQEMMIPLPAELVSMLAHLPRPCIVKNGRQLQDQLIPWPWALKHPTNQFRDFILKPAGLPADDPKLKFHAIRRTTASIIAATSGKEAARDAMGHSCIKVTERYVVAPQLIDSSIVAMPHPLTTLPTMTGQCQPMQMGREPGDGEEFRIALDSLPEELCRAFLLFYGETLTIAKIATITESAEGTVKGRLHRARKQLADHLAVRGIEFSSWEEIAHTPAEERRPR